MAVGPRSSLRILTPRGELDAGQPRIAGLNARTRFRHYVNISRTQQRLSRLLADFSWGRVDEVVLARAVH